MSNDLHNKDRSLLVGKEWDSISKFRKIHRMVTGIPLTDSMIKLYVFIIILSIFTTIFTKN